MAEALVLVASIRNCCFEAVYSALVMVRVSDEPRVGVRVAVAGDIAVGVGVRVNVAGAMGVEVGVRVNVGERIGVGVRVTVDLDTGVDVGVEPVFVVTVVTWLAELLALLGSNSCPETKASLSRLPVA